jgi:hypothetical protein
MCCAGYYAYRASGGALGVGLASTAAPVRDPCVAKVVTDSVVEAGGGSGAWASRHCRRHNGLRCSERNRAVVRE